MTQQGNRGARGDGGIGRVMGAPSILALLIALSLGRSLLTAGAEVSPLGERILVAAAQRLGWPAVVVAASDLPKGACQIGPRGQEGNQAAMRAWACAASDGTELDPLSWLESQGLTRGLYHGREAIIAQANDPAARGRGIVAWRCGSLILAAEDAAGQGREQAVAEALYLAAENRLGGLGGTVVLLADTSDTPGRARIAQVRAMMQSADAYYAHNGYGRVAFDAALLDADGPKGALDWHTVGRCLSAYVNDPYEYSMAATLAALRGTPLPEVAYIERVVVVAPAPIGPGETIWPPRPLVMRAANDAETMIAWTDGKTQHQVRVRDLILLSETAPQGAWVHELGHTLYSRDLSPSGNHRLTDRYDGANTGHDLGRVGPWDVMGQGSLWGDPSGSAPTHMSSYTKLCAGWLHEQRAEPGRAYELVALEHQAMSGLVLRVQDPLDGDPYAYYLIEARDSETAYGAPSTGIVVYHITHDAWAGHDVVAQIPAPHEGETRYTRNANEPTLYGVGRIGGQTRLTLTGGLRVVLLAESFAPYRATVRIERIAP